MIIGKKKIKIDQAVADSIPGFNHSLTYQPSVVTHITSLDAIKDDTPFEKLYIYQEAGQPYLPLLQVWDGTQLYSTQRMFDKI
jgi:hypothetical protein